MHKTITPKVTETDTDYAYTTITNPKKGTSTTTTTITKKTSSLCTTTSTSTASTTTTITLTLTAPAPPHFTPIQSSLPGSSNGTLNDIPPEFKRDAGTGLGKRDSPHGYSSNMKTYPKKVVCDKYKTSSQCSTTTVTKTKKSTAKPKTVHVKVRRKLSQFHMYQCTNLCDQTTTTITSTECPSAKATVTSTCYTTKTSTGYTQVITTTTSTATKIAGTKTVNAACLSSANYANQISGMRIVQADPIPVDRNGPDDGPFVLFQVDSPFECCNAAFNPPGTYQDQGLFGVEIFFYSFFRQNMSDPTSPFVPTCGLVGSPSTCAATQADGPWLLQNSEQAGPGEPTVDAQPGPVFGNARCGEAVGPSAK